MRQLNKEWNDIARTLKFASPWFAVTTFSFLMTGLFVIPQTYLFAKLIVGLPRHLANESEMFRLWRFLAIVIVLRGVFKAISEWSGGQLAVHVKTTLRRLLLSRLVESSPMEVQREQVGEWIQTAYGDIENVEPFFRVALPQLVSALVLPVCILVVVFWFDWISGLILLITAPLIPFFMILLGRMSKSKTVHRWQMMRRLGGHFYDIVSGLTTLKWFNRSKSQVSVVARVGEAYRVAVMESLRIAFLSSFVMELLATLGTAMVAVGVGLRLLNGNISFVYALTTIILAGEFYLPLRSLGSQFHVSMEGRVSLQHIHSILDTTAGSRTGSPMSTSVNVPVGPRPQPSGGNNPIIRTENLMYTYPGTAVACLDRVNISVHKGDRIAIIGPSGAGKSTLLSVLLGSITPQVGTVYVHGERLCERNIAAWRREVAYIGQMPHIFSGTVLENLKITRPTADMVDVLRVAEQAGVAEFAERLPRGFETTVGSGGVSLSSGQIQRIALARALLKASPVWLLDEPTAHLDVESEQWFTNVLKHLPPMQTVLVIAHRLTTVEHMNQAFLMQGGSVKAVRSLDPKHAQAKWYEQLLREGG
ncbi:thiol reductant ABC exporter subunit CydD [Alicyclobacillus sp. ALC3]|uniref:thiol reductant ABC exporter subunit CydD n=1 Tax=Alicyclobacillus sp. ALC3 TaxID=2796143 RepID=UPI0023799368|nr:thiol reductant ABC exporter subunit CydD [Alicyclobacillus sp. ALC3]WDL95647.1 thiol reductant ABC exporter subunit CydD [Alicyclobacillus sp. ALC3]